MVLSSGHRLALTVLHFLLFVMTSRSFVTQMAGIAKRTPRMAGVTTSTWKPVGQSGEGVNHYSGHLHSYPSTAFRRLAFQSLHSTTSPAETSLSDAILSPEEKAKFLAFSKDLLKELCVGKESNKVEESSQTTCHILDVACGRGVFWEFLLEAAKEANIHLTITGVNEAPAIVEQALLHENQLLPRHGKELASQRAIQVIQANTLEYCSSVDASGVDGVILNAGWDADAACNPKAILPYFAGKAVAIFHGEDIKRDIVEGSHGLPAVVTTADPLSNQDTVVSSVQKGGHLTLLHPCRATALPQVHRYRGKVDQGYGRGGKKLGVPTANLPASLFQDALEDVETGVYLGWASLERSDGSNPTTSKIYKAVANVGYSPTFEGKENAEKIIEAHLIVDPNEDSNDKGPEEVKDGKNLSDFYGVYMRLQLTGFLRPEQKFDSFPQLIAQIHADINEVDETLNHTPYQEFQKDPFLDTGKTWVGAGGSDDSASWEFTDQVEAFQDMLD